jgi:hypothetical protein
MCNRGFSRPSVRDYSHGGLLARWALGTYYPGGVTDVSSDLTTRSEVNIIFYRILLSKALDRLIAIVD